MPTGKKKAQRTTAVHAPNLTWWSDAVQPLAIRALWQHAPGDYELDLGEAGTPPVRVSAGQTRPVEHVYAEAGRYMLTARLLSDPAESDSTEVVVRSFLVPQASIGYHGSSRVRLVIEPVPSPVRHAVDWGDGTPVEEFGEGMFNPEHQYTVDPVGRVVVLTDVPAKRRLRLTVPQPEPERPAPAFTLVRTDTAATSRVRVLLRPPTAEDDFDHRSVAHRIAWGDGVTEDVPAGRAHADHDYGRPGPWPEDVPVPTVTVHDPSIGKQTSATAVTLRAPYLEFARPDGEHADDPAWWRCRARQLPVRDPGKKYTLWTGNKPLHRGAPEQQGLDSFEFDAQYPAGWSTVDMAGPDGPMLCSAALRSGELTVRACAVDWDPDDPRLVTVTPFVTGEGGQATVDWGDPEFPGAQALSTAGPDPRAAHWYSTLARRTVTFTPAGGTASTCVLGPVTVDEPVRDPDNRLLIHLTIRTLDAYQAVRIDWGDKTPVLRHHPGAVGGTISHTYPDGKSHQVTVTTALATPLHLSTPKPV